MMVKSAKNYNWKAEIMSFLVPVIAMFLIATVVRFFGDGILARVVMLVAFFGTAWLSIAAWGVFRKPFFCRDCGQKVEAPLENSQSGNEAILYHCQQCEVLWHVGQTNTGI